MSVHSGGLSQLAEEDHLYTYKHLLLDIIESADSVAMFWDEEALAFSLI